MARKHIEFLKVRVGEGQHLREERVEADVIGELASEIVPLVLCEVPEALDYRGEYGIEPILRRLGVEIHLGKDIHVGISVDREGAQARRHLVQQIGVGRFRQQRGLVVGFEGGLNLVGLVGEVEHHRALSSPGAYG